MKSEKITYVKPAAVDLGPVAPIYGDLCATGNVASTGCNPTGQNPGPFTCSPGSVVTVCNVGIGDVTR